MVTEEKEPYIKLILPYYLKGFSFASGMVYIAVTLSMYVSLNVTVDILKRHSHVKLGLTLCLGTVDKRENVS